MKTRKYIRAFFICIAAACATLSAASADESTAPVVKASSGAIVGIVIGTALGLALVASLRQQGITETVVPVSNLVIFLLLAAVLGLIAATWPARRAARLDILAAIATE